MDFYSISLSNVTPVKLVTAKANYGIGFLTAFVGSFCSLFGIPNNMFTQKLKKAETLAMEELTANAKAVGADGVMDVRCQIDGLSFLVCGTAYKLSPKEKATCEAEEKAKCDAEENSKYEVEESNNLNDNSNVPLEDSNTEKSTNQLKDDNYIYVQCKNCRREFSFQKGMRKVRCPWCNAKQD